MIWFTAFSDLSRGRHNLGNLRSAPVSNTVPICSAKPHPDASAVNLRVDIDFVA